MGAPEPAGRSTSAPLTRGRAVPAAGVLEYHTDSDALEAVQTLTEADTKKLVVISRYWWKRFGLHIRDGGPEDLLQSAVLQTLRGKRRWRKGYSIVQHLDKRMWSIASHKARSSARTPLVDIDSDEDVSVSPSAVEASLLAPLQLQEFKALFSTNADAIAVVELREQGVSASEIQARLNLSVKDWEAVRKYIRRKVIEYTKTGW